MVREHKLASSIQTKRAFESGFEKGSKDSSDLQPFKAALWLQMYDIKHERCSSNNDVDFLSVQQPFQSICIMFLHIY